MPVPTPPGVDDTPRLTRAVAAVIAAFLVPAVVILFLLPGETADLWAWAIAPDLSAMTLASAYVAGTHFFVRVARGAPWSRVHAGFPAVTVFVWAMGAATLVHLDRFNTDHVSFFAWFGLYMATPFAVPALWASARRTVHGPAGGRRLGDGVRTSMGFAGAAVVAAAAVMFFDPAAVSGDWPWDLTPLTARVTAGVVALYGAVWLAVAIDGRRDAARIPLEALALGVGAWLAAIALRTGEFEPTALGAVVLGIAAVVLAATLAVLAALRRG